MIRIINFTLFLVSLLAMVITAYYYADIAFIFLIPTCMFWIMSLDSNINSWLIDDHDFHVQQYKYANYFRYLKYYFQS